LEVSEYRKSSVCEFGDEGRRPASPNSKPILVFGRGSKNTASIVSATRRSPAGTACGGVTSSPSRSWGRRSSYFLCGWSSPKTAGATEGRSPTYSSVRSFTKIWRRSVAAAIASTTAQSTAYTSLLTPTHVPSGRMRYACAWRVDIALTSSGRSLMRSPSSSGPLDEFCPGCVNLPPAWGFERNLGVRTSSKNTESSDVPG
jgi:hypothetical protein